MTDTVLTPPVVATLPNRQTARTLAVGQDLCEELDRWSAYAQIALAEARLQARAASEMVEVSAREAARAVNLGQRHDDEIATVWAQLEAAGRLTAKAEKRLRQRYESWRHSERIVQEATRSWTLAADHARDELTQATLRHAKTERQIARLETRKLADEASRSRRGRVHEQNESANGGAPTLAQLLAEARVAHNAAARDIETEAAHLDRALAALATTDRAQQLVNRSMNDLTDGVQSAHLASDLVRDARRQMEKATSLAHDQRVATEALMKESRRAVRAVESSGPLLGAVDDVYDDAQRYVFEARSQIADRLETVRSTLACWSPPKASGRFDAQR